MGEYLAFDVSFWFCYIDYMSLIYNVWIIISLKPVTGMVSNVINVTVVE